MKFYSLFTPPPPPPEISRLLLVARVDNDDSHLVFNVDIAVYSVSMVITLVFITLTCCSLRKTCFANCQHVCVHCIDIPINYEYPYHTLPVL